MPITHKKKKYKKYTIFKKRTSIKKKQNVKLSFGDFGLFTINGFRLEFKHLVFIKRMLKFLRRRKRKRFRKRKKKIWLFVTKNYIISNKSKNARMGKGKGKYLRRAMIVEGFFNFLEFRGVKTLRLIFFKKKIERYFNIRFRIFGTFKYTYPLWANKGALIFFKKYRYI